MTNILLSRKVGFHRRDGINSLFFSSTSRYLQVLLDHPLVWHVDWFKVKAGFFAIVDPTDPKELLYLSQKDFQDMIKVALSNREPLVVVARAGETQPPVSAITAPNPNSPNSPIYFRSFRVYSKFLRALWSDMWEGRLVVPLEGNLKYLVCSWSKILEHWLGIPSKSRSRSAGMYSVSQYLMRILKTKGPYGLSLFLKVSLIAINKYLASEPLTSTWSLGFAVALSGGLPTWIPQPVRKGIRDRSLKTIRLWSSLCYLYKGLHVRGAGSYRSILASPWPLSTDNRDWLWEFQDFLQNVYFPFLGIDKCSVPQSDGLPPLLTSAGPSGGTGIAGALRDAWVWHVNRFGRLRYSLEVVLAATCNHVALGFLTHGWKGAQLERQLLPMKIHKRSPTQEGYDSVLYDGRKPLTLSRLHFIYEAAGKVRVIGILDYFSQWAFRPVHDHLVTILSTMYEDGTSDQSASLERFILRVGTRTGSYASLDISSATDRIPYQLYEVILGVLYGNFFARHYMRLLRDRNFITPKEVPLDFVRYRRGQPMGALSSFPLLGLVHHAIVQYSAYLSNQFPFATYCVVGDDVILFEEDTNTPVTNTYLSLCSRLGIPINKSKTYTSSTFFNFISRSFVDGKEVTPASMRAELSVHSLGQRVETAIRNCVRWSSGDPRNVVPRISKMLTDHWTWSRESVSISSGHITSYLALLLSAVFTPGSRGSAALELYETGWTYWLASLRGSTIVFSHAEEEAVSYWLRRSKDAIQIARTAMLAIRSELESQMVSETQVAALYVEWLIKQPSSIRLLYPLIREKRGNYAYWNMSCREVLPLLGYPLSQSESPLEWSNYEELLCTPHEELIESYIMELLIYNMGFMVPRDFVDSLREFYKSWVAIFADDVSLLDLGHHLRVAIQAVLRFKPGIDFRDTKVLSKVSRDVFGQGKKSSYLSRSRFEYAKEGFSDRLAHLISVAWRLLHMAREQNAGPIQSLPLPVLPRP